MRRVAFCFDASEGAKFSKPVVLEMLTFVWFQPGSKAKMLKADSQADVETFRQDTLDLGNESEG